MHKTQATSAAQDVVWRLHPTWGEWVAAGWDPYYLDIAERWLEHGWGGAPGRALRWLRAGVRDPRMAKRYETNGWDSPELFHVVSHLGQRHNMTTGAAARILNGDATFETLDRFHRWIHREELRESKFDDQLVLFVHRSRWDAASGAGDSAGVSLRFNGETFHY